MVTPLVPELAALLHQMAESRASTRLPFIVTLSPTARAADVLPFEPRVMVPIIHMVAGEMTADQALALSGHPQVVTIEFDGEAHAINDLLKKG